MINIFISFALNLNVYEALGLLRLKTKTKKCYRATSMLALCKMEYLVSFFFSI